MVFSSIRRRLSITRTSAPSSTTSTGSAAEVPAERLVLIYGNCQAHWLGGVLAAQGVGLVAIVGAPFGFYPECQGVRPFFVDAAEAASLASQAKLSGRQVTILEQTSPLHAGLDAETQRLGSHVVRFPHLEMRSYWHPWLTKVGDGFAHDRIRRQFAFDLAAIRRSAAKAGLDDELADHLESSHRSILHFHTLNHPSAGLMQRLHAQVCAGLENRGALSRPMYDWAQAEIAAVGGMNFIAEHPLHDAVIDALDLTWAREGWYANWQTGYFAAGAGQHTRAISLIEAALADPACDPHVNYNLGILLEGLGEWEGALAAFGRAYRAYPQNPEYGCRWLARFVEPGAEGDHPLMQRLNASFPG